MNNSSSFPTRNTGETGRHEDPIQIFNNPEFGNIRVRILDGKILFCLLDLAKCLEYVNPAKAVRVHCNPDLVSILDTPTENQHGTIVIQRIKFGGWSELFRLCLSAKVDRAKGVQDWVFNEILPSVMTHGYYAIPGVKINEKDREYDVRIAEAEEKNRYYQLEIEKIKERNTNRVIELFGKIASVLPLFSSVKELPQTLAAHVANSLAGKEVVPYVEVKRKSYSATEIGEMIGGASKNLVSKFAKERGLKTDEYGKLFFDVAPVTGKEVETFRYYENVIPIMEQMFNDYLKTHPNYFKGKKTITKATLERLKREDEESKRLGLGI